jgi:hypothetical protein
MEAHKLNVKLFVKQPEALELDAVVPVFHAWIRNHKLDETMIDVTDYRHVPDGPGVVLIGHASDYCVDQGEGRVGLLYSRKRDAPADPDARLADAFRRALVACRMLEKEPALGSVRFDTDRILFRISDRLLAPNTPETHAALAPELERFCARLFAGAAFSIEPYGSPKQRFAVRIASDGAPLDTLLERLS